MIRIKNWHPIVLLILTITLHFVANNYGWYNTKIVWFDNLLHIMTGIAIGLITILISQKRRVEKTKVNKLVLITVLSAAIIWEILELLFLALFPEQAINYSLYSSSIAEASTDILTNLIGGIIATILIK
jgi:uncharacterized membrane protein YjdF